MEKIKILFMQANTGFGSDSRMHQLIMQYLDRDDFEVHCAINPGTNNEPSPAIKALEKVPDLHLRPTFFGPSIHGQSRGKIIKDSVGQSIPTIFSLAELSQYVRKNKIQLIHGKEKPRDAFYGVMLAKSAGAKSVIHLHVKVEDWLRRNVKWAMREADGLLGVSRFVAESAVKKGYDKKKAFYVLNALDSNLWNPDTDGSSIREEFNIAKDDIVMTICAVICSWKGHPELIEAMPLVVKEIPNIKLMIVGVDEPRRDGFSPPLSPILKNRAKELGVQDNVIFTGFRRDVEKILAASDFFTMPSFEEPCAVAYLEAMAMKLPIVALNQGGGAPEVIEHGQMGLLSDYKNIEQLAENMIILAKDAEMRKRMGEYNRKRLVEYYNPTRFATEAGNIFKHILGLGQTKQVMSET